MLLNAGRAEQESRRQAPLPGPETGDLHPTNEDLFVWTPDLGHPRLAQNQPVTDLGLDEGFQTAQGLIPLLRNVVEVLMHFEEGAGLEMVEGFAPGAGATHDARARQYAEVLGDGLPREARDLGELRDGAGLA